MYYEVLSLKQLNSKFGLKDLICVKNLTFRDSVLGLLDFWLCAFNVFFFFTNMYKFDVPTCQCRPVVFQNI